MRQWVKLSYLQVRLDQYPGLEVINLENSLRLKIKPNDWLLACQSLRFILSLRMNSSFITSRPDKADQQCAH